MLRVLDARVPSDRADWLRLWDSWAKREVSAHPSYVELFCEDEGIPICAAWDGPDSSALFPLILRPLPVCLGQTGWDLTSPYGYGGPFVTGGDHSQASGFWDAFRGWAAEIHAVSAFSRLSLFPDQLLELPKAEVFSAQQNVVVDLRLDENALWRSYEHKVRKNVNRARREGLWVEVDTTGATFDDFLRVYRATMDRRRAARTYLFTDVFFHKIRDDLVGQFALVHVWDRDEIVSSELALVSATRVYSFLGGTSSAAFPKRPNDLLKHELALWAMRFGKEDFVLGGGYGGDDGIYRYKRSFAPEGQRPFQTWRSILDEPTYAGLVQARSALNGGYSTPDPEFFPGYRR